MVFLFFPLSVFSLFETRKRRNIKPRNNTSRSTPLSSGPGRVCSIVPRYQRDNHWKRIDCRAIFFQFAAGISRVKKWTACVFRSRVYRGGRKDGAEVDGRVDIRGYGGRRGEGVKLFRVMVVLWDIGWARYGGGKGTLLVYPVGTRSRVHSRRGYILAADPTPAAPDPGRLN